MNRYFTIRETTLSFSFFSSLLISLFTYQNLSAQSPYCAPVYNYRCSAVGGNGLSIAQFALQQNGVTLLTDATGCSTATTPALLEKNYTFFSATTPSVLQGIAYDFDIQFMVNGIGSTNAGYKIWVDWNDNNDFTDAGETLASGLVAGSSTIVIPAAAPLGNHRMRVRARKDIVAGVKTAVIPADPCAVYDMGDTHDYTLNVQCASTTLTIASVVITSPTCYGGTDGALKVNVTGSAGSMEFSKDNGATFTVSTSPFTFTNLSAKTYPIIVKDATNCLSPINASVVTQPNPFVISATTTNSSCGMNDGGMTITASGGSGALQYSIDDGATFLPTNTFSMLQPKVYKVKVKDSKNCISDAKNILVSLPLPVLANTFTCVNTSVTLTPTGGSAFNFYTSDPTLVSITPIQTGTSFTFTPTANTTIWITNKISTCESYPIAVVVSTEDIVAPSVLCKAVTIQLDVTGNFTLTSDLIDNNSTDNCGITSKTLSKTAFDCSNIGTNTVIFTASDAANNSSTCSATVTVEDKGAPILRCKAATIQLDNTGNATLSIAQIDNNSTDNCGITTRFLTKTAFSCSNLGTNSVVFFASDANGNSSTCSATVTVEDKTAPSVSCKAATIQLDNTGNATLTTALIDNASTDNCAITARSLSKTAFNCSNLGTNTVVFTAADVSNNSATCSATVTVQDKINPSAVCKAATIQLDNTGNATLTTVLVDNASTDNCGITSRVLSKTAFNCTNLGSNTVVFTATDASSNSSTCSATVTVEDKVAPSVFCKAATIQLDNTGNATLTTVLVDNASTDNCGITSKALSKTAFNCTNLGTNTVVFTATDASSNSATCSATVTVEDKVAPSVFCKAATIQLDNTGNATLTTALVDNASTDNCGITSRALSKTAFNCTNLGTNTVVFTATDASSNSSTCSATITVEDKVAPSVLCKAATIQLDNTGNATLAAVLVDNGSTDNCVFTSRVLSKTAYNCSNLGSSSVVFTVTDASNNSSTCSAIVTVEDKVAPSVFCKAATIQLDNTGNATLTTALIDNASTDNCGITTRALSKTAFNCSNLGTNTVVFTATDASMNVATCSATVTVQDKVAPSVLCKAATIQLDNTGSATLTTALIDNASTDNCGITSRVLSKTAFNCNNIGSSIVVFTATDASNNSATCSTTVTVEDKVAPTITCPPNMVVDLASGECQRILNFASNVTVSDNCTAAPVVTQLAGLKSGEAFGIGAFNAGFKATDANNNSATCFFTITVNEHARSGSMVCSNQVRVTIDENCHTRFDPALMLLGSGYGCYDNYSVKIQAQSGFTYPDDFITDVHVGMTLRAIITDNRSGTSCQGLFSVFDFTPPTLKAPIDVSVSCDLVGANGIPNPSITGEPTVLKECSRPTTYFFTDKVFDVPCNTVLTAPPAGFPSDLVYNPLLAINLRRMLVRTFTVADRYNNTATTRQVIYINTRTIQDVTIPPNLTLTCGSSRLEASDTTINGVLIKGTGYPIFPNTRGVNDCFCSVTFSYTDTQLANTGSSILTIQRNWRTTNYCTNELRTWTQTIKVNDVAPVVTVVTNKVFQLPATQILTVNAQDLISSLTDDCTPSNKMVYGLRLVATGTNFPLVSSLNFDCHNTTNYSVEVWVKDEARHEVMKIAYFSISNTGVKCPSLAGMINREDMLPVPSKVMLYNANNDSLNSMTGTTYLFQDLFANTRLRVQPSRPNTDWTNGLTVFDLALMSRHILGTSPLNSPYKLIAADVNHSGEIDAVDLLLMQRMVLRVIPTFPNNNSWRFVVKDYVFSDNANPFASDFPESLIIPNLTTSIINGDFVAIKVGDVNLSAGSVVIRGGIKPFNLMVEDKVLVKGKTYNIPIKIAPYQSDYAGENLTALQFALSIDKNAVQTTAVEKGDLPNCNDNTYGIFKEDGIVTAAWYRSPNQRFAPSDSFTLIHLTITPTENTRLSQILSINPIYTEGVAYDEKGQSAPVKLSFGNTTTVVEKPTLLPNRPNPFTETTTLSFILPEESRAKLTVYDLLGRVVMHTEQVFAKGLNEVLFDAKTAPSVSSGIFVVRLQTAMGMAEQKIVFREH